MKKSQTKKSKIIKKKKNKNENKSKMPTDEFSKYIFEHINMLRENPKYFIKNIEEAKSFIARNKDNKLIYKKNKSFIISRTISF